VTRYRNWLAEMKEIDALRGELPLIEEEQLVLPDLLSL
jgi:hypothetical protein